MSEIIFKKLFPNTIFHVLSLILVSIILASPLVYFERGYFKTISRDTVNTLYYVFGFAILIGSAHLINYKNGIKVRHNFKVQNVPLWQIWIVILFTFQVGLNAPIVKTLYSALGIKSSLNNPLDSPVISIGALTLGPILEEIFFRGIILNGLLERYTPKKAIIISTIIFTILHFSGAQIFGAFILGLVLAVVYFKTNSLGLAIAMHFFANLFGLFTAFLKWKYGNVDNGTVTNMYGDYSTYIIVICLTILAFCIYLIRKDFNAKKTRDS